jgi:hypothetical protein
MRSQESIVRSGRNCGWFFITWAVISLLLSLYYFHLGRWGFGLQLFAGSLFFGWIGWCAGRVKLVSHRPGPDEGGSNRTGSAGKPVPVNPTPIHHLIAAKDLPPSDKTHSWPKD